MVEPMMAEAMEDERRDGHDGPGIRGGVTQGLLVAASVEGANRGTRHDAAQEDVTVQSQRRLLHVCGNREDVISEGDGLVAITD
jgi:hypothetical protein